MIMYDHMWNQSHVADLVKKSYSLCDMAIAKKLKCVIDIPYHNATIT